ncbi:ABC transporter, ATP-binding protein family member protein [Theileria equi strain WA]|uniref:ABC transporter, ATP-binding protein family member protein n=1 Tax=Theileria equi strain WA TaxID=1537102 RepID=L1LBC5_THEEQ|nr:ABC transporter, ATP-binding protein family member protein [Theileria equi strain WA]EKX72732.1 ABC transporter, ATP-binding protein family member protein [Theileria equi strain WA]|eukprot:XP_004832184.1 ABC transporter, ATP-binding protein family member protein [Theileria equi strain WA]
MMVDKGDRTPEVYDHHFWESEPSLTLRKVVKPDGTKFRYFDETSIFNFIFFLLVYRWVKETSKRYLDPYMIHPLPLADQILKWQPILSRHVSDGIASIEAHESLSEEEKKKAKKPVRCILARAVILTYRLGRCRGLFEIFLIHIFVSYDQYVSRYLSLVVSPSVCHIDSIHVAPTVVILGFFLSVSSSHCSLPVQIRYYESAQVLAFQYTNKRGV